MGKENFTDHQNKCFCCFFKLSQRQKRIKITKELTQFELKVSTIYSDQICAGCDLRAM